MSKKRYIELFDNGKALIPPKDCPLIVLSTHLTGDLQFLIRKKTQGTYNHIMFLLNPTTLASQGWLFSRVPLTEYHGKGWKLKFWGLQPHYSKKKLEQTIRDNLNQHWIKRRYDLLGCICQGIPGLKKVNVPYLYFCSERVPKIINEAYGLKVPNHLDPEECNQYFKDNQNTFKYYGHYTFD